MQFIKICFSNITWLFLFILVGASTTATAATFTVTNTNNSGAGSLRQAVLDSNAAAGSDTIVFDSSFNTTRTITLTSTITIDPATGDSLTITAPGANLLTVSGNNAVQIFFVNTGDTAAISGMTLTAASNNNGGAGVDNRGNLTVTNVAFTSNFGNNGGGAISNSGTTSVTNSSFNQNSSNGSGGAISNNGNLTVTNSTFTSNTGAFGGAIFHGTNGTVMISGCAFTNNISNGGGATGNGGGAIINIGSGTITVSDSTFTGNSVQTTGVGPSGGAIRNRFGTMNITNSTFSNNTAANGGGAIDNGDIMSISGSTFTGNSASGPNAQQSGQGSGGAISSTGAQMTINNSVISGNSAVNHGGGVYITTSTVNINNTTVSHNVANTNNDLYGDGGGVWIRAEGRVTVTGSTISSNRTNRNTQTTDLRFAGNGGGFFVEGALTLNNSTVSGNFAELNYGGIVDTNPGGIEDQVHISNSTIVNNHAAGNVGGFGVDSVSDAGQQSLRNTIIANNVASGGTSQDVYSTTSAPINSLGYNLIKNITGATIGGTTTGNIYGQDPLLGPLANNDGATRTHALRPGSPAIDAGDPATFPATDQRGVTRPQDGDSNGTARADIGAYERRPTDFVQSAFADFDGDNRADISVFRPSNGAWYLQQSTNGFTGIGFGQNGDVIVPADYDGDGRTDVAVFRSGIWYLQRSTLGF
ncbi:MAG TPA: choice-of-anchor Q domain-containing protein, partial [Pyrinomonadaceae bacterium]|nr:choice-of-anchor Q domain-containing protein [Pyrinomonadaceae bacterium]